MERISITELSSKDFEQMEVEWDHCLSESEANLLFSCWNWQKAWWDVWQPRLDLELLLIGIYDAEALIGIAPCYTYRIKQGFSRITRCEFIGSYSYNDDSIRSEYLNFIFPRGKYSEFLPILVSYLKTFNIDELVLNDVCEESTTAKYIVNNLRNIYLIKDIGIRLNTVDSFESYLQVLGKNTRSKLYHCRKKLESSKVVTVSDSSELSYFWSLLNEMHEQRWGKPCFSAHSLKFHQAVAENFLKKGGLAAKILVNSGIPIAVCYDIVAGHCQYNIQLGFVDYQSNKLSLGTIMLGHAIESAHQNQTIEHYDLLAGKGKNSFYKSRFHGETQTFVSLYIPMTIRRVVWHWLRQVLRIIFKFVRNYRLRTLNKINNDKN